MSVARQWKGPCKLMVRREPRSNYSRTSPTVRARVLALAGVEVRATQSSGGGGQATGGKTAHEPAGSPKGGQFTSSPGSGIGYQSILPPASAYKSGGGGGKKAPTGTGVPAAPTAPRTMKPGDSGEDVRYAQYAMSLLGFKVDQNGNYDQATADAVKQIQERLGVQKPNEHLSSAQLRKLQDAVRLSPCVGQGQRDLALEAQWEARDVEELDDVIDESTEALIAALGEFVQSEDERSFNEALHPRNPKGSVGGGRFRSIADRIVAALSDWKHGNGPDDPLKDFNRDQLLKAAKAHGHTFRRGAPIEEIKAQILDDVRTGTKAEKAAAPHLPGAPVDHRRFTIQLGGKADPAAVREVEVENKIRAVYEQKRPNYRNGHADHWLGLADLREALPDVSRQELDAALVRMGRGGSPASRESGFHLIPVANSKALKPRDRAAEVSIGGEGQHAISFEDASPLPLPKSTATATDVGIFGNPTTGRLSLYRESDTGKKQGRAIKSFDDMGQLEAWARDNGHTELADYAKAEQARTGEPKPTPANGKPDFGPIHTQLDDILKRPAVMPKAAAQIRLAKRELDNGNPDGAMRELVRARLEQGFVGASTKAAIQAAIDDLRQHTAAFPGEATGEPKPPAPLARHIRDVHDVLEGKHRPSMLPLSMVFAGVSRKSYEDHFTPEQRKKVLDRSREILAKMPASASDRPGLERVVHDLEAIEAEQARTGGAAKVAKAAPAKADVSADPLAGLEGLTTVQKRAALRKRGLSKAEIDALAPLQKATKAPTASPSASDAVDRLNAATTREEGKAALQGLSVAQLREIDPLAGRLAKNKADLMDRIVDHHVGGRLSFATLTKGQGSARGPEANPSAPSPLAAFQDVLSEMITMTSRQSGPRSSGSHAAVLGDAVAALYAGDVNKGMGILERAAKRARERNDHSVDYEALLARLRALDLNAITAPRRSARSRVLDLLGVTRALGHDVTPGHDELHHWWTKGPGLARWIGSPTQFRTLRAELAKATKGKIPPEELNRFAASWVHEVTGFWPGSDMHRVLEGSKPRGHRIGPG